MTSTQELVVKDQPGGLAIVLEPQNVRRKPVKKALEEDRFTDVSQQNLATPFNINGVMMCGCILSKGAHTNHSQRLLSRCA